MDDLDRGLVQELVRNCRISFSDLATNFDVSVTTIKNRVEQLVRKSIIVAFDVCPKWHVWGLSIALVIVKLSEVLSQENIEKIGNHPFVMYVAQGIEPDAQVSVIYRTNEELREAIDFLHSIKKIQDTEVYQLLPPLDSVAASSVDKNLDALKKIDWEILCCLRWNGRMPLEQLATKIGRSVPTVRKRLEVMRKDEILYETVLFNISATATGLVINIILEFPSLSPDEQRVIERDIRTRFSGSFWSGWRVADRPMIILVFEASKNSEIVEIRRVLAEMFPSSRIAKQIVVGDWQYFPDFRDDILKKMCKC
ncbi:MAG: winged helix-turn-helix transcriptional regulator [Candidatus Thorarchaeota archaeon]